MLDPAPSSTVPETTEADGEEAAATDFSSLISDEVTDLRDKKKQRFRLHDTGLKNCMFIEMDVDAGKPGPCEVCCVNTSIVLSTVIACDS